MSIYNKETRLYGRNARELRDFDLEFLYQLYFSLEEERCGIITTNGIVGCDNISKTPEDGFHMGKIQYRNAAKFGDVYGFIHSHFAIGFHDPIPSISDVNTLKRYKHLNFNILIILWSGEFLFWNQNGVFEKRKITPSNWHQIELDTFNKEILNDIVID